MDTLADILRRAREAQGLTQKELGERIGLEGEDPQKRVSLWERGAAVPGVERIAKLAFELRLDELELFRLKYQGTRLELHLGSPSASGREKQKPKAMEKIEQLFSQNTVSPELRDRCYRLCRLFILGEEE